MSNRAVLIRFANLAAEPWCNGGGVTRELAAAPYDAATGSFAWRVSVADVSNDGPFSTFAGVDRQLVMCEGAGMVISVDGEPHRLAQFDTLAFPGDVPCIGTLVDGPTTDLNVMTLRGVVSAVVRVVVVADGLVVHARPETEVLLVALTGPLCLSTPDQPDGPALERFDTRRVAGPARVELAGSGRVAVIELEESP